MKNFKNLSTLDKIFVVIGILTVMGAVCLTLGLSIWVRLQGAPHIEGVHPILAEVLYWVLQLVIYYIEYVLLLQGGIADLYEDLTGKWY